MKQKKPIEIPPYYIDTLLWVTEGPCEVLTDLAPGKLLKDLVRFWRISEVLTDLVRYWRTWPCDMGSWETSWRYWRTLWCSEGYREVLKDILCSTYGPCKVLKDLTRYWRTIWGTEGPCNYFLVHWGTRRSSNGRLLLGAATSLWGEMTVFAPD
jgi:hypothetical protein